MKRLLGMGAVAVLVFSFSLRISAAEEAAAANTPKVAKGEVPKLNTDREKVSYILGQNVAASIAPFKKQLDMDQFMIGLQEILNGTKGDPVKLGYAFGRQKGNGLVRIKDEFDLPLFFQGVKNKLDGLESPLKPEEVKAVMTAFGKKLQAKREAETKAMLEKNKAEGTAFLEKNKTKKGVKTTWSGLQYEVLKEGEGPTPKSTDLVQVSFKNQLIDGTELGSGKTPLRPANSAIPGWTEAMMMMNKGSKYRLYIPPELAYGEKGMANIVAPNTVIISELEMLDIQPNPEGAVE